MGSDIVRYTHSGMIFALNLQSKYHSVAKQSEYHCEAIELAVGEYHCIVSPGTQCA